MKKVLIALALFLSSFTTQAQSGYEITIDLKNYNDTLAYLTFYRFDKTLIKDTCTTIKNGRIVFSGKTKLQKGIYSLVGQQKSILFDFFVDDDTQKLHLKSEFGPNISNDLSALNSDRENEFFNYIRFLGDQNKAFIEYKQKNPLTTKKDTLALAEKQNELEQSIADYENQFINRFKGTFIADVVNLKTEKKLKDIPKKADGTPDHEVSYKYYKDNFWRNVDFKDDGMVHNPFLFNKLKNYLDNVVVKHPDSVSVEIDKILAKSKPETLIYKLMLAHLTYTYETSKIMGFDKVFVHLSDNYFKTGKAKGIYEDDDVVQRIIKRADKLKTLLIGAKAIDLSMIKAEDFPKMKAMGFEDAKNSEEMTKVFYKNVNEVNKMWVKLSDVKADYTVLIFWDVDCGHCQKEIPKLVTAYNELVQEKKNVKVFSVYMQHEGDKYLKYIADNKLPFINVYDGAHYNNAIEKYDVYSTPVIYILDKNKVIKAKRIEADKVKEIIQSLEKEAKN
ncbi:TlpA family protein disulfide reductase [Flavobacterium sp.]|uniref:TlpA family protein disulfide reductase n=1 Tax=Flavobacterium sp. TaxID=239 RepID=UPI0025D04B6B|nr:TlpA family protein disulfide reductase [Flavobacterium sp.]